MNACEGEGFPSAFWRGNDYDSYYPKLELVCDEGNGQCGVNRHGAMIGQQRSKKWCVSFDCAHWGARNPIALAIDFSEEKAICFNAPLKFWQKYKPYQLKSRSLARVAVLRERNSLAYNRYDPWEETLAMEQYLIESRIPFDFVHNAQLDSLADKYDLLIGAGIEIISDRIRDSITDFVAEGGSLLLTGSSGVFDEHYRQRQVPIEKIESMDDFRKAHAPLNAFHELIGSDPQSSSEDSIRRTFKKGRAAWIRCMDVDRASRTPEHWRHSPEDLMMPRNAGQIDCLIRWLVPEGLGISVSTRGKIYTHHAERPDTGEQMIHLINHEYKTRTACATVRVRLETAPAEIVSVSMDDKEDFPEREETFTMESGTAVFRIHDIGLHRTAILRF